MALRRSLAILLVSILAAAGALAAPLASANQRSGPYAVGSRSYTFVDPTRATPANGTYPGAPTRTLQTLVLYPAQGDPAAPITADAPPVRAHGQRRFPLVVFAHGFTASGPAYTFLLALIAKQGYVVAAPTFPLSSISAPGGPTITDYIHQPGDVSFVIDRMTGLARTDPLRAVVKRGRVGVAGHSLGAITTLGVATNSCCLDPRIDVAIPWSGIQLPFPGGSFYSKPTPPLLLIHGDSDHTVPYGGSLSAYNLAPAPKALVTLLGGPHVPFLAPWLDPTINPTLDFLDRYLKGDRDALERLASDANVPGAASLQADLGRHGRG